jgi:single-stranded-DNA-specific exonuclease
VLKDMHPVMRRIFLARGVRDEASLSLTLKDLQPPAALSGIEEAASLLADAVVEGSKILIVGDFDADGATGTALAVLSLRAMGSAGKSAAA